MEDSEFEMTEMVKAYLLVGHRKKAVDVSSWNIAKCLQWWWRLPTDCEKRSREPHTSSREPHNAPAVTTQLFKRKIMIGNEEFLK